MASLVNRTCLPLPKRHRGSRWTQLHAPRSMTQPYKVHFGFCVYRGSSHPRLLAWWLPSADSEQRYTLGSFGKSEGSVSRKMSLLLSIKDVRRRPMQWRLRLRCWFLWSQVIQTGGVRREHFVEKEAWLRMSSHLPSSSNSINDWLVAFLEIYAVSFISFIKEETLFSLTREIIGEPSVNRSQIITFALT
jgi:hypothetical protein